MTDTPIATPAEALGAAAQLCDDDIAEYSRKMAEPGGLSAWAQLNAKREAVKELATAIRALASRTAAPAPVDPAVIEASGKRWHGEDHRVVSVRWEPYKPEGARQMKAPGRWQECQVSGDFHRWQNCDRPTNLIGGTK